MHKISRKLVFVELAAKLNGAYRNVLMIQQLFPAVTAETSIHRPTASHNLGL